MQLNDEVWSFVTSNQVDEVFPYILSKFSEALKNEQITPGSSENFYKLFVSYLDALPEDKKLYFLYNGIKNEVNEQILLKLSQIIKELNLYNFDESMALLKSEDFQTQKRGLKIVTYDKPFYNKQDKKDLDIVRSYVENTFTERGIRTTKKQLLSSKEKEVWTCECGKTNDIGTYCSGCSQDIYGFKVNEVKPLAVHNYIQQKIELITEYVE